MYTKSTLYTKNNIVSKIFTNSYKSLSLDKNTNLGVTRHYPPASKEWKDSVYSYNKTYTKDLSLKDEKASILIKSYLSFIPILKKSTKSWRMRMLIRRSSTKKLFVSKPEIKQTSDKTIITVYMYDRQKLLFSKKLYLLRKSLLTNSPYIRYYSRRKKSFLSSKISRGVKGVNLRRFLRNPYKRAFYLKKQMYKHRVRPILFAKNIMSSLYRKKTFLNCLFFFYFMKWTLSIFRLNVNLKGAFLITKDEKGKVLNIRNKSLSLSKLRKINIILLQYLLAELEKITTKGNHIADLSILFREFKKKYHMIFMKKHLKTLIFTLKVLSKFNSNKRRYTTMVDGLKSLIHRLYDKKVELNLVNLKYLHMNSDNFSDALTTKLKRKKGRLLKVLKKSLKIVKKPLKFSARLDTTIASKKPRYMLDNDIKSVLNSLKYKWVTGIRLEARGRLTRRFIAARAVYKFKYKGSLRNLEHLYNTNYKAESPSVFMLRNQFRPNIQHSFAFSKKRIGSFGIKGWISSV